jgi:hypothetical protein
MKKKPIEKQMQMLNHMMYHAFLEIRMLGRRSKSQQASDLADAFHNLPVEMFSEDFDWDLFRNIYLKAYHEKYPQPEFGTKNYISLLDKILEVG